MKDKDFADCSTLVRKLEANLVSDQLLSAATSAINLEDTFSYFTTHTSYAFDNVTSVLQADQILAEQLGEVYSLISSHIPYGEIIDILSIRYEFESLKTALYTHLSYTDHNPFFPHIGSIPQKEYHDFFTHQDPFISLLPDYLLRPAQHALSMVNGGANPHSIQEQFPKAMFAKMLALAGDIGNQFIVSTVKAMVDFHNILSLLKVKTGRADSSLLREVLVEGGATSTSFFLTGVTRALSTVFPFVYYKNFASKIEFGVEFYNKYDNFDIFPNLLRFIQASLVDVVSLLEYGPEIPFAYIIKKENEISKIRKIIYGKDTQVNESTLKSLVFLN